MFNFIRKWRVRLRTWGFDRVSCHGCGKMNFWWNLHNTDDWRTICTGCLNRRQQ